MADATTTEREDDEATGGERGGGPDAADTGGAPGGERPAEPSAPAPVAATLAWLRARRRVVLLVPVCLLALTVRLWAVYEYQPFCPPDPTTRAQCFALEADRAYVFEQGAALADGEGFIEPGVFDARGTPFPGARSAPLFPAFLGLVGTAGYEDVTAQRVAGAFLGTATVLLVGLAARQVARSRRDRAMVLAATFAAVYPPLWQQDANLQAESLLVALVAASIIAAYRVVARPSTARLVVLGAFAGLLALTRVDGIALGTMLVVATVLVATRRAALQASQQESQPVPLRGRLWRPLGVALGTGALVIAPWVAYNAMRFTTPVIISTGGSLAVLDGTCEPTLRGSARGAADVSCADPLERTAYEVGLADQARSLAWEELTTNAAALPGVVATRLGRAVGVYAPWDTAVREQAVHGSGASASFVGALARLGLLIAAAGGAVTLRRRQVPLGPLLVVVAVPMVSVALTYGADRIRVPADVAILVLASIGLAAWTSRVAVFETGGPDRPDPWPRWRRYAPLLLVAVLALTVRLFAAYEVRPMCTPEQERSGDIASCLILGGDPLHYHRVGISVSLGRGFTMIGVPTAQHPPAFYVLSGALDRVGLKTFEAKRPVFALVGTVGVTLLGLVGFRVGGRRAPLVGCIAAGLAAFYPSFVTNDIYGMSESVFLVLMCVAVLAVYRMFARPTFANAALVGTSVGLAWLTRTEAIGYLLTVLVVVLVRPMWEWRRRLLLSGTALAVACIVVTPWLIRNLTTFEDRVLFTTNVGQTLVLGACDEVATGTGIGLFSFACLPDGEARQGYSIDESTNDRNYRDAAVAYYREHPDRVPTVALARLGRMWNLYRPIDTVQFEAFSERKPYAAVLASLSFFVVSAPLAFGGAMVLRRRRVAISPLLGVLAMCAAVAVLAAPLTRYRAPADGMIFVLAAVALVRLAYGPGRDDAATVRADGSAPTSVGNDGDGDEGDDP